MSDRRAEVKRDGAGSPADEGLAAERDAVAPTEPLSAGSPSVSADQGSRSERRVKRTAARKRQQRKRLAAGGGVLLLAILVAVVAPILLSDDAGADRASSQIGSTTSVDASASQDGDDSPQTGDPQDGGSALPGSEETSEAGSSGPSTTYVIASGVAEETSGSSQPPITSPVRLPTGATSSGVAVFVTEEGALAAVVVLQPVEQGGVSVGIPATTVVSTGQGFETMVALHSAGDMDALLGGLGTILGITPALGGSAEASTLDEAIERAAEVLEAGPVVAGARSAGYAARRYAQAVLDLAHVAAGEVEAWTEVVEGGDASATQAVVSAVATDEGGEDWQAAVLPGTPVTAAETPYFDTDMSAARQLVSRILVLGGEEIALSVQNGSGAVGAAEAAAASLAAMDCTMLPFSNAPGFPDVQATVIAAGPGAAAAAQQVRALLGVGAVTEDESLAAGNVVVVVGKDLDGLLAPMSAAQGTVSVGEGEEG